MSGDLFAPDDGAWVERLAPGTVLLHGWACAQDADLCAAIGEIIRLAPLRGMATPGGQNMSVQTSSCGDWGWVSDRHGYRYAAADPQNGQPWPRMPERFRQLAQGAAAAAGFPGFLPDACLINCYLPGARMGLHQDKDERDFAAPIVSVSLGLPAVFLLGGLRRADRALKIALHHGDVLVWGAEDRMRFHGVQPVKPGIHPLLGERRVNLTFRKAR
ncbi:alpha-ketoglutarate-dependent dioxygenase AlkB [Chromobacterium sphagni]|uniref:Alpha-ketoglutarate-dependent dioxygenase AlkB n=1 Tax=Chromobacterium sphagni TaxID=1903179 RepID=A0A1S1WWI8_9NEIS|nr:DNA oxidative demethylase AlkB [Chromobacterium sphagni]OHX11273.1 alpha-ketoglutarate-dependent dioxygenase AlkB [Chromobacterium sphagni]